MFCASWWRRYRPPCVPTEEYIRAAAAMAERYGARRYRPSRPGGAGVAPARPSSLRPAPSLGSPPPAPPAGCHVIGCPGPGAHAAAVFVRSVFVASDDAGAVAALRAALPHLAIAALDLDRSVFESNWSPPPYCCPYPSPYRPFFALGPVFESNWCPATAALTGPRHARGAGAQPLYILLARDSTLPRGSRDPFLHTL